MALSYLFELGIVKHVVSQNCDGLHLRSGLPKTSMSEVHGNMYIEVCRKCTPPREYVRTFDVTEKTSTFKHATGRRCYKCGEPLIDSIVHFGERGRLRWPLNWQGACQAANACDTILCLGSSLKVLKKYPWLWQMNRTSRKRPRLYIINLQWTPKDKEATLKINGKCDNIMENVMKYLGLDVDKYGKEDDPLFDIATTLNPKETSTTTQPILSQFDKLNFKSESSDSDFAQSCNSLLSNVKKEVLFDEDIKIKSEDKPEVKLKYFNKIKIKDEATDSSPRAQYSCSTNDFSGFEDSEICKKTIKQETSEVEFDLKITNEMLTGDGDDVVFRNQFYGTGLCIRSQNTSIDDSSSSDDTAEVDSIDDNSNINSESDFSVRCEPDSSEFEEITCDIPNISPKEIVYSNICDPFELIYSSDQTHSCVESDKENEPTNFDNLDKSDCDLHKENYMKIYDELNDEQKEIDFILEANNHIQLRESPEHAERGDLNLIEDRGLEDQNEELKAIWMNSFCQSDSMEEDSSNNDDIKNIWFWGFDTQLEENQESVAKLRTLELAIHRRDAHTEKRVTRSSNKSLVTPKPKCSCAAENYQLCANKSVNIEEPEYSVAKARQLFRRKRTVNYKRFNAKFELALPSLTYERKKRARRKYHVTDQEEIYDTDNRKPKDNNTNPGWYGKGYRKTIKKRK